jgi:hypothetical protein
LASQRDGLAESACQLPNQLPEISVQVSGHRTGSRPVPYREPPPPRSWQEHWDAAEPLETIQPISVLAPCRFILHRKASGGTGRSCG